MRRAIVQRFCQTLEPQISPPRSFASRASGTLTTVTISKGSEMSTAAHEFRKSILDPSAPPLIGPLLNGIDNVELLSMLKFDYIFLDLEHSMITLPEAKTAYTAAQLRGKPVLARLGSRCAFEVARHLDSGAASILFPMVNSAEDADFCVRACRFPPSGRRGRANLRWNGFGLDKVKVGESSGEAGVRHRGNTAVSVGIQIETVEALNNLSDIISVEGVDFVFLGSMDIATDMGLDSLESPLVRNTILDAGRMITERGICKGTLTATKEDLRFWTEAGFRMNVCLANKFLVEGAEQFLKGREENL